MQPEIELLKRHAHIGPNDFQLIPQGLPPSFPLDLAGVGQRLIGSVEKHIPGRFHHVLVYWDDGREPTGVHQAFSEKLLQAGFAPQAHPVQLGFLDTRAREQPEPTFDSSRFQRGHEEATLEIQHGQVTLHYVASPMRQVRKHPMEQVVPRLGPPVDHLVMEDGSSGTETRMTFHARMAGPMTLEQLLVHYRSEMEQHGWTLLHQMSWPDEVFEGYEKTLQGETYRAMLRLVVAPDATRAMLHVEQQAFSGGGWSFYTITAGAQ